MALRLFSVCLTLALSDDRKKPGLKVSHICCPCLTQSMEKICPPLPSPLVPLIPAVGEEHGTGQAAPFVLHSQHSVGRSLQHSAGADPNKTPFSADSEFFRCQKWPEPATMAGPQHSLSQRFGSHNLPPFFLCRWFLPKLTATSHQKNAAP